jgi:hypothetical protein
MSQNQHSKANPALFIASIHYLLAIKFFSFSISFNNVVPFQFPTRKKEKGKKEMSYPLRCCVLP